MDVPALVTLHLWGVSARSAAPFTRSLASARLRVARTHGAGFARLLGTATGARMTLAGADPRHWALLACWPSVGHAESFERALRAVDRHAVEALAVRMRPLASRGRWSGRQPFGGARPRGVGTSGPDGLLAVLTRARIRARHLWAFSRAAGPVASDLSGRDGLLLALGIGEAPVGLSGTFSIWSSALAAEEFAYGRAAHRQVVRRTAAERWYAEDLFARFAVVDVVGRYRGHPVEGP